MTPLNYKTALCLSGHMRTFDQAAKSPAMQSLINDSSVDIYVSTWGYRDANSTAPGQGACYYPGTRERSLVTPAEIIDTYKTNNVEIFASIDFHNKKYEWHNRHHFGNFEDYKSMYFLIKQNIKFAMKNGTYDYIIRSRPDVYLFDLGIWPISTPEASFPISGYLDKEFICTDLFYHGDVTTMERIMSFFDVIDTYLPTETVPCWHEALFNKYVKNIEVPYIFDSEILFQVIRPDGNPGGIGFKLTDEDLEDRKIAGITFDEGEMCIPEIPHV